MRQLLQAVAYLHSVNVLHGDISTNNVMFDNDNAVLIDFGTAEVLPEGGVSTCTIGTTPFAAPERSQRQSSFAADVFALGMTFACLAGHFIWETAVNKCAENVVFKGNEYEMELSDLLYGMTRPMPKTRYTIEECLGHAFWKVLGGKGK